MHIKPNTIEEPSGLMATWAFVAGDAAVLAVRANGERRAFRAVAEAAAWLDAEECTIALMRGRS